MEVNSCSAPPISNGRTSRSKRDHYLSQKLDSPSDRLEDEEKVLTDEERGVRELFIQSLSCWSSKAKKSVVCSRDKSVTTEECAICVVGIVWRRQTVGEKNRERKREDDDTSNASFVPELLHSIKGRSVICSPFLFFCTALYSQ